jgi:hypothetical protein
LAPLSLYNLPPYLHTALFRNLFLWNRLYAVREAPLYYQYFIIEFEN